MMTDLTQKRPGGALPGDLDSPENFNLKLKNSTPGDEKEVLEKLK